MIPGRRPSLPSLAECRDCHEPIRFVRMDDTAKALPVNPAPGTDGNVAARLMNGRLTGFVISRDRRPGPLESFRFTAHHASCEARERAPASTPTPADAPLF